MKLKVVNDNELRIEPRVVLLFVYLLQGDNSHRKHIQLRARRLLCQYCSFMLPCSETK